MAIPVVLEVASKRTFASALDWPGWARAGRTETDALAALLDAAARYAAVARRAGLPFRAPRSVAGLVVAERVTGNATTNFGAPSMPATVESEPVDETELGRFVALLRAAWDELDARADAASGVTLRTGPRGGGRSVPGILEHVHGAERAYLSKLGSRAPAEAGLAPMHDAVVAALTATVRGEEPPNPARTRRRWPARYAVRRIAWHVLDHAWEIEDRLP